MSKLIKLGLGLGLFFYFLYLVIASIPAGWAGYIVSTRVPALQLNGVSGTVWKGKAASANVNLVGQGIELGELRWRFHGWNLLLLKACADIDSVKLSTGVCRSIIGANVIKGLQVDLPASLGNPLLREANFNGDASINLASAVVNDSGQVKSLQGNFSWRSAQIQVEGRWFSLGDYGAELSADGQGGVNAQIFDLKGPIAVKLNANASVDRKPSIEGEIIPSNAAPPEISDTLSFVAIPLDQGGFKIKYPL